MRGEGGVAGEGRVVGVPKFHSCQGKCTMPLTNINSDWMSNASSGLCINLFICIILCMSFKLHLGVCNILHYLHYFWNTYFHSLELNRIEDSGATALANALRVNHSLETLK